MSQEIRDSLLLAIQSGDANAFGRWMAEAEPRIRASLRSFASQVDTEAVLQETLLRIWQVAPRVEVDTRGDALLRMGVRIGRNLAIDHVRARQAQPEADVDVSTLEQQACDSAEPDPLLRQMIADCIGELPGKPAQAFHARLYGAGAEPDETLAVRLGMKLNTFLKNFGRARAFLIECLGGRGVELSCITGERV